MNGNAKEYALAIFAVALENDSVEQVHEDLLLVRDALVENPEYKDYLVNPAIPKSERMANLELVFSEQVCDDVFAFLNIICDHGDVFTLEPAIEEFNVMFESHMRMAKAVITSAVELTEDEKTKLITKLQAVTKKNVEAVYVIDKSLIGGVTVDVDGKFYDGSVRKNLKNLKEVIS
ncbi:MAG: ATP synthase F1 subunit delta [Clostridia bacterium]|nr:ATP synthase F1 subunit delta [Clostridia bacterium]